MKVARTDAFRKDYKAIKSQGMRVELLWKLVRKLANNEKIDETKHPISHRSGWFSRDYSVRIEIGWILMYHIDHERDQIVLVRTGSPIELH